MAISGIWWTNSSLSSLSSVASPSPGCEACVTSAICFGARPTFLLGGIVGLFCRAHEHGGHHCWDLNCQNRNQAPQQENNGMLDKYGNGDDAFEAHLTAPCSCPLLMCPWGAIYRGDQGVGYIVLTALNQPPPCAERTITGVVKTITDTTLLCSPLVRRRRVSVSLNVQLAWRRGFEA